MGVPKLTVVVFALAFIGYTAVDQYVQMSGAAQCAREARAVALRLLQDQELFSRNRAYLESRVNLAHRQASRAAYDPTGRRLPETWDDGVYIAQFLNVLSESAARDGQAELNYDLRRLQLDIEDLFGTRA